MESTVGSIDDPLAQQDVREVFEMEVIEQTTCRQCRESSEPISYKQPVQYLYFNNLRYAKKKNLIQYQCLCDILTHPAGKKLSICREQVRAAGRRLREGCSPSNERYSKMPQQEMCCCLTRSQTHGSPPKGYCFRFSVAGPFSRSTVNQRRA
jgi:hypothetical protein